MDPDLGTTGSTDDSADLEVSTALENPSGDEASRRQFLGWATVGLSGVIMGGLGIPAFFYLADVAAPGATELEWIPVGNTSLLDPTKPVLVRFTVRRSIGWVEQEDEVALFLLKDDAGEIIGLSNICSHLGCRVRWVDERQKLFCPCHNGVFSPQGEVEEGPPPSALDRFDVMVDGDQILVRRGGGDA